MNIFKLRKEVRQKLNARRTDKFTEISGEDINIISRTKKEIFIMPIIVFGLCLVGKKCFNFLKLPHLIKNPLKYEQPEVSTNKFVRNFVSNNIIVLAVFASCCLYTAKYEVTKFYFYLKYENLVFGYLKAAEDLQLKTLSKLHEKNEI